MEYKRMIRESDGIHIIICFCGWIQHYKFFDNGKKEEWIEPDYL